MNEKHKHYKHTDFGECFAIDPDYFEGQLKHLIGRPDCHEVFLYETHNCGWHIGTKKSISGKSNLTRLIEP